MKKLTKFFAVSLATLTTFGALAGCSSNSLGELEHDFTESDKKIEYTFFSTNWQDYEGATKDRIIKHIEDKFNVDITITGASGSTWTDRLAAEIADNETPDLFFALPDTSTITDYIKKQVITDLNPYIEKANATNLQQILNTEQYKETTLINGKNYFVPQSVGYTTRVLLVRKDWMRKWNESLGKTGDDVYAEPSTLSEFTSMLSFFRNGDPDGDGKKNTYGLALSNNFDYVQDFFATFGISPEYYLDENGDYQISALSENYGEMLKWFAQGNSDGYLYSDFYMMTETESLQSFYQGICGAVVTSGDLLLDGIINEIKNAYPGQDYNDLLTLIAPPDSDDGTYKGAFKGWNFYWGGWCVSADAEEPMRLIKILDYLFSAEGQKLLVYGIKGTHYTEENGVIVPNNTERLADGSNAFSYPDASRLNEPAGRYMIGYQMIPCPYTIENNRLVINYPYDTACDSAMMKKAYDLTIKNTPNFNALSTIIANPDINDYNSKIIDAVETYSINIISGNNTQSEAYTSLMSRLTFAKHLDVLVYINKNNK